MSDGPMDILPDDAFSPVATDTREQEQIVRPGINYWHDVWRRLRSNKVAMLALFVIVGILLFSIFAPMLVSYQYNETDLSVVNSPPSAEHWFGTDSLGRDLWARVWIGARVSLIVGVVGAIIPSLIGMIIGGVSGYFGGKIDMLIMRIIDISMCVPSLIYVILIMVVLGPGVVTLLIALAITGWLGSARSVRGLVLQIKEFEFVLAARALGASPARLILRHLIPNTLGIFVVGLTMAVPGVIFNEAYLSFIGLGIQPPMTSWGQLARLGAQSFRTQPYMLLIPSIFICLTMLSFNLFGDGLRDALDPKLRQ